MPITMPGLASHMQTDEMIKKLVEVEKQPIIRLQNEKKLLNLQEKIWKSFKGELKTFDNILKRLYSFNRIFKEKAIVGDFKKYFSAMVSPGADDSEHTIEILQLATAHKIITDKIDSKKDLPPSNFTLKVGDRTKKLKFQGGSIKKFERFLRNNASELLKVNFVKLDADNYKMSIASKFTGKNNKIDIIPNSTSDEELFNILGFVKQGNKSNLLYENFNNKDNPLFSYSDNGYNNSPALFIKQNSSIRYTPDKSISSLNNPEINFMYKTKLNNTRGKTSDVNITNKNILKKDIGNVTIKDVTIESAAEILNVDNSKNNKKSTSDKNKQENKISVFIYSSDNQKAEIELTTSSNWRNINNKISNFNDVKYIEIINKGNSDLYIDELKIVNKSKDLAYKNEVEKPQNAKILIDDIPIEREKNSDLKDILDRVTFNLKNKTPHKINFRIKPDKEKIEKKVKDFVDQYNNILEFISIVSKTSSSTKPGEEQDKKKKERGALSNDISLMNIKSKMRSTVVGSYETSLGDDLSILAQIGISTGGWGSSWENIRKGFLQFDESKFDMALDKWGAEVGEIFGYDSNGDKIIDTGVAYKLSVDIKPFIQLRGIIDGKINLAKTLVKTKDKIIADKEDRLNMYENKLKTKFTRMEEALSKLNAKSKALQNQINNLNGGSKSEK